MVLPEKFQIQEGLIPEYVTRRKFYEVIEEFGRMATWEVVLWSYAILWWNAPLWFWLVVSLITLGIFLPFYIELEKWASEIYVVANDPNNIGGKVYRFKGIFNYSRIETPITVNAPIPTIDEYENNIAYWFWKTTTGSRMQKVTLKSDTGYLMLSGTRMPPEFVKAIERVRGTSPNKKDVPPMWQNMDGLIRAKYAGIWTEAETREKAEILWRDMMNL